MRRRSIASLAIFGTVFAVFGLGAGASADEPTFEFGSNGCSQFVTNLQVDAAKVRPFVPDRYRFSREAIGKAAVGYRIHSCEHMTIAGEERADVVWAEFGVRIASPEGRLPDHIDQHMVDGHDYYMIFFHTNDAIFAAAMARAGVPASHVPSLRYDLGLEPLSGTLSAGETVPEEGDYAVGMQVLTAETPRGAVPDFHVISWYEGAEGLVRYDDFRTVVTGRLGPIQIQADPGTTLARITGQTDMSTIDALVLFATSSRVEVLG